MRTFLHAISVHLLILQMLLTPAFAPALHEYLNCSGTASSQNPDCRCCSGHNRSQHSQTGPQHETAPHAPHHCSSCSLCHAIFAPRIPAPLCCLLTVVSQTVLKTPQPALPIPCAVCRQPQPRGPPLECRSVCRTAALQLGADPILTEPPASRNWHVRTLAPAR